MTYNLNDMQNKAVMYTEGPLLILAGAGSGKTRVLVHRISHLIADEGVSPGRILAITFTNKAADEMRQRIDDAVGFGSGEIWVMTFHACAVRILRAHAEKLGYSRYFSIYDTDDQKRVMKDVCKKLNIDTSRYKEKAILGAISRAKDELIDSDRYEKESAGDFEEKVALAYREYEKVLKQNNAFDFDDLIVKTVELLRENPDVLKFYQEKFMYIHVDEYQDTNTAQFVFVKYLAGGYKNLCVVGDDDQSIYKFRGANIKNILSFEETYPDAQVVRLEQNYRSTENILNCANAVISNNKGRKRKKLWTDRNGGRQVRFVQLQNGFEEAEFVASEIEDKVSQGMSYKDFAVLYRTNAQSRYFEEKFIYSNIPYKVVGGVNFYSRMEIKDIISYLKTIDNGEDDLAVRRIINVPKRGIGGTTIAKIDLFADAMHLSFYEALLRIDECNLTDATKKKIKSFISLINKFKDSKDEGGVRTLVEKILKDTGYLDELKAERSEEADARIENLEELISKAQVYDEGAEDGNLTDFLAEVALIADIDSVEDSDDKVLIMTLHSSKGLEFPNVYMAGMEDGLFPGYMTIEMGDDEEMEEERRLCYVGITRAMNELTLTSARERMLRGNMTYNPVSRFVGEIPMDMLETNTVIVKKPEVKKNYTSFAKKKEVMQTNPFAKKQSFEVKGGSLDYSVGDRVSHIKFGEGTVQDIVEGGRDFEVTVDFDEFGTRKMFAGFAKLQKI